MSNVLTDLYLDLLDFIEPLRTRLEQRDALEYLFYRYGWDASMDDAAFARFQKAATIIAPIEQFTQTAEALRTKLGSGSDLDTSDIEELTSSAGALIKALAEFGMPHLDGLPDPLSRPEFWESIAEQVFDDLLEQYLRVYQPIVFLVLRVWNVIRYDPTDATDSGRVPYTRVWFDWDQAAAMLTDPLQALQRGYHWGDATQPFDHEGALEALRLAFAMLRVPAARFSPAFVTAPIPGDAARSAPEDVLALRATLLERDYPEENAFYRLGLEVYPALRGTDQVPAGLILKPILEGGAGKTLPLNSLLSFTVATVLSADDAVGLALFPGEAGVVAGAPAVGASLTLQTRGTGPWYVLGSAQTSHIELSGFLLRASVEGSVDDPEFKLLAGFAGTGGQPGAKAVMTLSDADQFVQETVSNASLEFTFSPQIVWSSKAGLMFNGKPTISFDLPLSIPLGPITLTDATLSLGTPQMTSAQGVVCRIGVGIRGSLGPIDFAIAQLGFECIVTPYTRDDVRALPDGAAVPTLGAVDVHLQFAPPSGVGLSIDAAGVSGGGFLAYAADQYNGVLQLEFNDLALQAFGLITTQVAGSDGYSLLALIDADFPPVQLGWGFTLDGVGGLLAVHRTASVEALRSAVKAGKLSFLFPKNAITNAPQILGQLDTLFPTAPGRFLFGPMALIGWGTPTVLTASVAVILGLPEPIDLILLANLTALLPNPSAALVRLNMDALGVLDLTQDDLSLDASLFDSRLINFPIYGDMSLRANWSSQREFLLAVGGFHPQFSPPPGFPSLHRVTIDMPSGIVSKLRLAAYLALTSNSVQFGATLDVFIGVSGCGISGHLGFDALLQLNPFHFAADISGSVAVTVGRDDLASVSLDASLSGPAPWHIAGKFKIHVIFFDVHISFSQSWGLDAPSQQTSTVDVGALLSATLADSRNWNSRLLPGLSTLVTTRRIDDGNVIFAHPFALLEVHEEVVPLNMTITHFGEAVSSGTTKFSITDFRVGNQSTSYAAVQDDFAPAQFFDLSDNDKLSRPSFERHDAGAVMSGNLVTNGTPLAKTIDYESFFIDTPGVVTVDEGVPQPFPWIDLPIVMHTGSAARKAIGQAGKQRYAAPGNPIRVAEPAFAVANTTTLAAVTTVSAAGTTYSDVAAALHAAIAATPLQRTSLQIVGTYELKETA